MKIRRLPQVAVAMATLVGPLAALGQVTNGSVTTAPLATAPAMGIPVLMLLVVVLAAVAAYAVRRRAGEVIAVGCFVAVLTALTGMAYAFMSSVMVQGGQCGMQTTQAFDPNQSTILVSHCPSAIQITSIHVPCDMAYCVAGMCSVGQVLTNGESCMLPGCSW